MKARGRIIGNRKGMLYEALQRLDALMAIGEKRREAKAQAAARGEPTFPFSDGRIHSYHTRETYQDVIMRFLKWCRASFRLNRLADIDVCAEELACTYLEERISQHYSSWTLATERSALRLFFGQRDLAAEVLLPARKASAITRSRHAVERDRHIKLDHWQHIITFCQACGLRRSEVRDVRVGDICHHVSDGLLVVQVRRGKGGKWREAPVLAGCEEQVLSLIQGRHAEEHVFAHVPVHLDIQAYRRLYAQRLYEQYAGRPLPPVAAGPLRANAIDHKAALRVSRALGHERLDVVLLYYLR